MKKSEKSDSELIDTVKRFIESFEHVFDKDWEYSKEIMGIQEETVQQKKNAKELGLKSIEIISSDGTFINPKVSNETEDWGFRGALLQEYRRLKKIIKEFDNE